MLALPEGQNSPENPNALATEAHKTLHKENRLKQQSDLVLKSASELIGEYEKCEELLKTLREKVTIGEKWKDGVEKAKRILEGGRLVGEKKVESVMNGVDETGGKTFSGGEIELREGEALYEREAEVGAWAQVAKAQEKVVKRMTRLLPE